MKSNKRSNSRRNRPAAAKRLGSGLTWWIVIATAIAVAAAAFWWSGSNSRDGATTMTSFETAQGLVGRWQRTDAGYVIDIRHVDRYGTVEAVYLNPNLINVSQARVSDAGGRLELFLELMDVGYPGATYRLGYNPEYDVLVGLYHQPTAGQDFEVAFERK